MQESKIFSEKLLHWHSSINRDMPWKLSKDPYKIWVSEIILQQTRVEQGKPYYLRFINRFPSIEDLASANEDEVLKVWQGLGYYSRARNMHSAAKEIIDEHDGVFPNDYNDILALKGIGPYTAAAISSFAFDQSYPVVDGNVKRVISRLLGLREDLEKGEGKKRLTEYLNEAITMQDPASFNQAIMDFGALHCTPSNPGCGECVFNKDCYAFKNSKVAELPPKKKPIKKRTRYLHYLVVEMDDKVHIQRRNGKGIWKGLYEFLLVENKSMTVLGEDEFKKFLGKNFKVLNVSEVYNHKLSHQDLRILFYHITIANNSKKLSSLNLVDKGNLRNFAFPKIIDRYLEDKKIYL